MLNGLNSQVHRGDVTEFHSLKGFSKIKIPESTFEFFILFIPTQAIKVCFVLALVYFVVVGICYLNQKLGAVADHIEIGQIDQWQLQFGVYYDFLSYLDIDRLKQHPDFELK